VSLLLGLLDRRAGRERARAILRYRTIVANHKNVTEAEGDELAEIAHALGKTRESILQDCTAADEVNRLRQLASEYRQREADREATAKKFAEQGPKIDEAIEKLREEKKRLATESETAANRYQEANNARSRLPRMLRENPDAGLPIPGGNRQDYADPDNLIDHGDGAAGDDAAGQPVDAVGVEKNEVVVGQ
jgi:DNA repair exonuclease SbcCD ATPase subunit